MAQANIQRGIAAAVLLAALCAWGAGFMWDRHPPDLSALYLAGHMVASGQPDLVYAAPEGFFGAVPPEWSPALRALGLEGQEVLAYVYPPIWAVLLAPVTEAFSPAAFFRIVAVIEMALLFGSVLLAWRLARGWVMPLWAWLTLSAVLLASSAISFQAVTQLQPQIVVVFLVLLAFARDAAGRPVQAGAILALAAGLKLAPAALVLIFLLDRNWRALAAFAAGLGAIAAMGWWLAGPGLHAAFLQSLAAAGSGVQITGVSFSAKVPVYVLAAMLDPALSFDMAGGNIRLGPVAWADALCRGLGLAGVVWAVLAVRGLDPARRRVALLFLLTLLIGLFGPLGWAHYYLPQLFLLPALAGLMPLRAGGRVIAAAALATSWPVLVLVGMNVPGDPARAIYGTTVLLLLFLAVVAGLPRCACRAATSPQTAAQIAPG